MKDVEDVKEDPGMGVLVEQIEGLEEGTVHIMLGTPDDGCEVCVAHPGGKITKAQMESCFCPLCAEARATTAEENRTWKHPWGAR